jgi:hypothetical protein
MNKFDVILDEYETANSLQVVDKASHAVLLLTESNINFIYVLQMLVLDIYRFPTILNDKGIERAKQVIERRLASFSMIENSKVYLLEISDDVLQIELNFAFDVQLYRARLNIHKALYNCIEISFGDINALFNWQTINVFNIQFAQYEITTTATVDSSFSISRVIGLE